MRRAAALLAAVLGGAAGAGAGPPGPVETPGTRIAIESPRQTREGDVLVATGGVRVTHGDLVLVADEVRLDERTRTVQASGNVVLHERGRRIAGARLELDLDTRLGRIWDVWGYEDPDLYIEASEVEKQGEDRYALHSPRVTACNQPRPQWRLAASSGTYLVDEWVRLKNVRLEVLGVPLVYVPFIQYPARRERSTGFLFPSFGTNDQRGFYVGNGFFWAIGRSYDATFTHEYYRERGSLFGAELRYVPSDNATGTFATEHSQDTLENRTHSSYRWVHNQRLGRTFRLGADVNIASDETLDREFSNSFDRLTQRNRSSRVFVERNWSRYSFAASALNRVTFFSTGGIETERRDTQLPAVAFSVRDTRLAGPLYASLGTSAVRFDRGFPGGVTLDWQRYDADPRVRLALVPAPWLRLTPEAGYRLTWYTKSYEPGTRRQVVVDDAFLRRFGFVRMDLTGPVVERVFHTPSSSYSEKYKHVIEPVVRYEWAERVDPEEQALLSGDSIDLLAASNQVAYGFRTRLIAKRRLQEGARAVPYELALFSLSQTYSLERETERTGPIEMRRGPLRGNLRLAPGPTSTLSYDFFLEPDGWLFTRQSLHGTFRGRLWSTDVTYTRNRTADRVTDQQVRGGGGVELFGRRIQLGGSLLYDVERDDLRQLAGRLIYHTQCCGLGLGYNRYDLGGRNDSEVRFSVTLRRIGTVFDYTMGGAGGL